MSGKYRLATLGCKVNQYESQQIREVLESYGLRETTSDSTCTLAVVNTCAVTSGASRKSRQIIRRLAQKGKTPVVVVGCGASAEADRLRELNGVAAVYGHDAEVCHELRTFLQDTLGLQPTSGDHQPVTGSTRPEVGRNNGWIIPGKAGEDRQAGVSLPISQSNHSRSLPIVKEESLLLRGIESFHGHQRAFLKIQDGCDAFCTYCIIPRLRPRLRSKPLESVIKEAEQLVHHGHSEIILTGIFLGAYGRETAIRKRWGSKCSPLAELITALGRVSGLARLRLSSLEPGDVNDSLLDALASNSICVPHLHLPLQSGSQSILRRMNRQYNRDQFEKMIERVQNALDRPAISTDIIVGFPGETEADFEATLNVARSAGFLKIHAFPFSPREQTAAARWQKDFIHPGIVKERMRTLSVLEQELSLAYRRQFLGETQRVIVEQSESFEDSPTTPEDHTFDLMACHESPRIYHGRSDRYFEIHFESHTTRSRDNSCSPDLRDSRATSVEVRPGDIVTVRIDRLTPTRTHGTCIDDTVDHYPLSVLSVS